MPCANKTVDTPEDQKRKSVSYTITPLGASLLQKIAEYHGISKTSVIEMIARQEARRLGLE